MVRYYIQLTTVFLDIENKETDVRMWKHRLPNETAYQLFKSWIGLLLDNEITKNESSWKSDTLVEDDQITTSYTCTVTAHIETNHIEYLITQTVGRRAILFNRITIRHRNKEYVLDYDTFLTFIEYYKLTAGVNTNQPLVLRFNRDVDNSLNAFFIDVGHDKLEEIETKLIELSQHVLTDKLGLILYYDYATPFIAEYHRHGEFLAQLDWERFDYTRPFKLTTLDEYQGRFNVSDMEE